MNNLVGKNILFIAPVFHDYYRQIIQALSSFGATVDFFPERKYNILFKVYNHFSHTRLLHAYQEKHYNQILKSIPTTKEYDYLFVIRGYMITSSFLRSFKSRFPKAKRIMYQWDSNKTNPFSSVIQYFDKVLSFDYYDCSKLSLKYLQLFYSDDLIKYNVLSNNKKYDFFFMGTYLPERYNALKKFNHINGQKYRIKNYIYIPKSSLIKERLKGTRLDMDICTTDHLAYDEYLKTLACSRVMVDVSNKKQTGLAMRIIEALSLKVKVATNNKNILNEPYYNPNNITVFNPDNPIIASSFISTPFIGAVPTLSVEQWLDSIFFDK